MENLDLKHRCYTYESTGIIVYDPNRNGHTQPWWAIIEVEQDLVDYYRLLFLNTFKLPLMRPNWKAHITMFKGHDEYNPSFDSMWKEKDGHPVSFVYGDQLFWNKEFVWLNCYCPEYFILREKAGLTHEDNGSWGHITIGKFRKPEQIPAFANFKYPLPKEYL